MLRSPAACPGYCAAVRTLLRSPTGDAATPPAFWQLPRWLASCCSSLHVLLVSSPAPEVTVQTERTQNVLRSLHQQRPQIGIAFFADVHLWLALPRVSSSRLQSQI